MPCLLSSRLHGGGQSALRLWRADDGLTRDSTSTGPRMSRTPGRFACLPRSSEPRVVAATRRRFSTRRVFGGEEKMGIAGVFRILLRAAFVMALLGVTGIVAAATIVVNSAADGLPADDGQCTLREAIIAANTNTASGVTLGECTAGTAGADVITFAISAGGVHTIAPASALPIITEPVTIDGTSQSGWSANTNPVGMGLNTILTIELNLAGTGGGGLVVSTTAAGSIIQGLVVNRSPLGGITLSGASIVQGCFIGTNPAGTAAGPGNFDGIVIASSGNLIGGTSPAARNLISGNSNDTGINFAFIAGETSNLIQGNLIGTNFAGTAADAHGFGIALIDR